jgi:UDP-N-acetylglucosamine acyltransferase
VIHPQAIVDPSARIGANVTIGAFSVVGPDVEIGDGTWIGPHVVINGPTRIGRDNRIYQFASLGDAPQHLGYRGEPTRLEIGDRNVVREYCTFNRGTVAGGGVTRLGHDNFIMAYCHLAHDCRVGNNTIFANCASLAGHVTVGDYAVLGGFTVAHQFCRIGAYCMTALGAVTFMDIPPYVTASGNPAEPHGLNLRGLKRRGFSDEVVDALRQAYKTLYKSRLKLTEAIERLEKAGHRFPEVQNFVEFIKASERGIIR